LIPQFEGEQFSCLELRILLLFFLNQLIRHYIVPAKKPPIFER